MPELRQNIVDDLTSVTTESWRTFRIMAEMVQALDTLNALKTNCISIFGSARCTPDMQEYQDAEKIAHMLVDAGFGIITGGGPGIMEAANKGAFDAGGESVGLHIHLPHEQGCNKYVKTRCNFRYFFIRKFMFVKYAMAYVVMPGGMGTIAPNPYYTDEIAKTCMETIFLPTMHAMNAEGRTFKGCLYFGLMLTPDGPKVIEYNCRFGDPETQVVLPLLEGDLLHIMQACTNGTLENEEVKFSDGAAACVILASGGYPVAYEKGKPITGLVDGQLPGEENVTVYHSGTAITEDGTLVTAGGRVLGVTATGPRLTNALSHAYEAAEKISFEKLHKRTDIGMRALKAIAEQ